MENFILTTSSFDTGSFMFHIELFIAKFLERSQSIFEVFYRLKSYDFAFDGNLPLGPITDRSTIDDLSDLVSISMN